MGHSQPGVSQDGILQIPYGTHICHLYKDDSELFEVTIPYCCEAINNEELCLVICPEKHRRTLRDRLSQEKAMLLKRSNRSHIVVIESSDATSAMTNIWSTGVSIEEEYRPRGVRVSFISDSDNMNMFDCQEFDCFLTSHMPTSILCSYCTANSQISELLPILKKHKYVLLKQKGKWELIEQPSYVDSPLSLLDELGQPSIALDEHGQILGATKSCLELFGCKDCKDPKSLGESLDSFRNLFCVESGTGTIPPTAKLRDLHLDKELCDYWSITLPSQQKKLLFASLRQINRYSMKDKVYILNLYDITHLGQSPCTTKDITPMIAHEIRNPLQTLKAINDLLKVSIGADQTDVHKLLSMSDSYIEQIKTLTEDLLAHKRPRNCKLSTKSSAVNLTILLKEILCTYSTTCGHKIISRFDETKPIYTSKEACRIRQVVTNLIDNAVKFTPFDKRIWVDLKTDGDFATIIVEDEGIGVPADEKQYIFEPFYRSSNVLQEKNGLGLGLYISKRLSNLLGGDLIAKERPQGGTIVEFSLPLDVPRNTTNTE